MIVFKRQLLMENSNCGRIRSTVHVGKKVLLSHCHPYQNDTDFYRSSHAAIIGGVQKIANCKAHCRHTNGEAQPIDLIE